MRKLEIQRLHFSLKVCSFYLLGSLCYLGEYGQYLKPSHSLWCPEKDRSKLSFSSLPDLLNPRTAGAAPDISTFTFHLWNQPPPVKESVTEVKKTRHVVRHKKKLEIDTDWVQSKTEVGRAVCWCFLCWVFAQVRHTHTPSGSCQNIQHEYKQEKCAPHREAHLSVWVKGRLTGAFARVHWDSSPWRAWLRQQDGTGRRIRELYNI